MHLNRSDINPSLEATAAVCARAGNPQRAYTTIQVAGTNGKTSTTRLIAALLQAAGLRVGRYTSPELYADTDRIAVNDRDITPAALNAVLTRARDAAAAIDLTLTAYEQFTVAAFLAFRDAAVDAAVLEVGMGGRWDATTVADPAVAVITGIARDHTEFLGEYVPDIAAEKAAIIKPRTGTDTIATATTAVVAADLAHEAPDAYAVIARRVADVGARLIPARACDLPTNLSIPAHVAGYQRQNIACAVAAATAAGYPPTPRRLQQVLDGIRFPGRFDRIADDPPTYFDGAHNPQAAARLAAEITRRGMRPLIAVGAFADKDVDGIIDALSPVASAFVALSAPGPRGLAAADLARRINARSDTAVRDVLPRFDLNKLQEIARVNNVETLLITGSLSLARVLQSSDMTRGRQAVVRVEGDPEPYRGRNDRTWLTS
ncbi:MAG: hypothetical protein LBS17_01335 [Actinomycetes bacterium]|jgi:dihydrofolate synthase/folylpolyglutamate synthase|nr:hypothetical protein [Actinomycetes bacterium]